MYAINAWTSVLLSVFPQAGMSADLFSAGPPCEMIAVRSASLILFSVSPSVKGCGFTSRLS